MPLPPTLLELAGVALSPPASSGSALVVIDAQRFYATGALALPGLDAALRALAEALARARAAGVPVVHVHHHGNPGTPFDPAGALAAPLPQAAPLPSEQRLVKRMPSAFNETPLEKTLRNLGVSTPVFAGFMTHMCVSSAVRDALERGFQPWVVGDACATRPLPDGRGGVLDAEVVHRAHLASLADRFAGVLTSRELWPPRQAEAAR